MMIHTKYHGYSHYGFRQKDFFHVYVKHVTPGVGPFLAQGHNLNKLSIGLLGYATYQILRL